MLLKFHGADWIGMIFGLISAYYIARHRRWGFVFAVIAGLGWIAFGIMTGSVPSIIANILFIVINVRGFQRWKEKGQGASNH
jgi:nicotinamide riboside transporter PnuC